jgi:hypothetical protein
MAKRKLSTAQRVAIRKELSRGIRRNTSHAELLKIVANKYRISTMTARWYLKSVGESHSPIAGRATPDRSSRRTSTKKTRKGPARKNAHPQRNGAVHRLFASVHAIAEKTFSRARQVKKLVPQWRAYISKEFSLKKLESRVRQELRLVSSKAQALHRKIRELTSQ